MGKAMDLDIVAEGVENVDQANYLAEQGCDCIQGYVFGMPMPADQVGAFLGSFRM